MSEYYKSKVRKLLNNFKEGFYENEYTFCYRLHTSLSIVLGAQSVSISRSLHWNSKLRRLFFSEKFASLANHRALRWTLVRRRWVARSWWRTAKLPSTPSPRMSRAASRTFAQYIWRRNNRLQFPCTSRSVKDSNLITNCCTFTAF